MGSQFLSGRICMINDRSETLRPILESQSGVHLTSYFALQDIEKTSIYLTQVIQECRESLQDVLNDSEISAFVRPLESLLEDPRILKFVDGAFGLFRNKSSFRILKIPIDLQNQTHLATSFHVKPILQWIQMDREFMVAHIQESRATLYLGNQVSFKQVSSIQFSRFSTQDNSPIDSAQNVILFCRWLEELIQGLSLKLYIVAPPLFVHQAIDNLGYANVVKASNFTSSTVFDLKKILNEIREKNVREAKLTLRRHILEFEMADQLNLVKKNIFQIARSAIQGKIKKLLIAESVNIFGKIDPRTGGVALHPTDLDHEDDDILDDIAQAVLSHGGEVITASKEDIPHKRPILALLYEDGHELSNSFSDTKHSTREVKYGSTYSL